MKLKLTILFTFFILSISCRKDPENGGSKYIPPPDGYYRNPVFQPVFADPSVIKAADGYYYAYATEDDWGGAGGLHIVPIIKSKDLVNWIYAGNAFNQKPAWKSQGFIWAPDICFINGKYYLYYSYSLWGDANPGIGLAIADKPDGPFIDHGKLLLSEEVGVGNSIDPFYIEDNGIKYLFWGSFRGIYGSQLSDDGKTLTGEKFRVAGDFFEGTYILKKNGYYYFFGSNGNCCEGAASRYKLLIGRSQNLKGPYLNKQGDNLLTVEGSLFLEGNSTGGFAGPGHNAEIVTDDAGDDWLLYHAIDKKIPFLPVGATRRPLMLDKITWENNWPVITGNQPGVKDHKMPIFSVN
jgi:arabinan endo-1,5-alpha-L-arabinosidase